MPTTFDCHDTASGFDCKMRIDSHDVYGPASAGSDRVFFAHGRLSGGVANTYVYYSMATGSWSSMSGRYTSSAPYAKILDSGVYLHIDGTFTGSAGTGLSGSKLVYYNSTPSVLCKFSGAGYIYTMCAIGSTGFIMGGLFSGLIPYTATGLTGGGTSGLKVVNCASYTGGVCNAMSTSYVDIDSIPADCRYFGGTPYLVYPRDALSWGGSSWSSLGHSGYVGYDTGNFYYTLGIMGSDLYAGGLIVKSGSSSSSGILKRSDPSWTHIWVNNSSYSCRQLVEVSDSVICANGTYLSGTFRHRIDELSGSITNIVTWTGLGSNTWMAYSAEDDAYVISAYAVTSRPRKYARSSATWTDLSGVVLDSYNIATIGYVSFS
jgi:hypothetical protein